MTALSLLDNYADLAIVEASAEVPTGRAINVQDPMRAAVWRGLGTEQFLYVTIPFAIPEGQEITHVALVDLNLTREGEIGVEAWADEMEGADQTVDITAAPWLLTDPLPIAPGFGDGPFGVGAFGAPPDDRAINGRNVTLIPVPGMSTAGFWRIRLTDTNLSYIQCSRLYLARARTFDVNVSLGWKLTPEDLSKARQSIGGQRFVQPRDVRMVLDPPYDWLSDAERTQQLVTLRRYGSWRPLIFSVYPEATDKGITTTLYGRYEGSSLTHRVEGFNNFAFRIVEEL